MIDWLLITTVFGGIAFITSSIFVFYRVHKKKPSLLKPAQIITTESDEQTTYNWNLILTIIATSIAFSAGVFILSNVVVFVAIGEWYIDSRAVGILAVVFGIHMFKEFDKFVTKLLK